MNMRSKAAFGLIEVMLALLVAALIITPLARLTLSIIENVSRADERLLEQIQLKRFLSEARFFAGANETFTKEENIDARKTMVFMRTKLSEKSVFFRPFLCKEEIVMQDKGAPKQITNVLITFYAVIPEPQQKEEKKQEKVIKQKGAV